MKSLVSQVKDVFKIIVLTLIFSVSISYVHAQWVGPSQAPPGGNTSAPINVGTSNQIKTGGLLEVFNFWVNGAMGVTGGATFGGNVGVGTTSPFGKLHVYAGDIILGSNDGASAPTINNGRSILFRNYFLNGTGRTIASIFSGWSTAGSAANSYLSFSTEGSDVLAERARITSTGNLGIGTTSPSQTLSVGGMIYSGTGGFKFPDGTVQTSSASVGHCSLNSQCNNTNYVFTAAAASCGGSDSYDCWRGHCRLLSAFSCAAPTLSFSASPTSIYTNNSSTLTWSSVNTTECTSSGDWTGPRAVSGTYSTGNLTSSKTYTLTCSGPGGTTAPSTANVTVTSAPPSINSFSRNDPSQWLALTWSSTNSTSCTRSSSPSWSWWNGTGAVSGTIGYGNYASGLGYGVHNFYLTCTGPGGTTPASTVSIDNGAEPPPPPISCFIAGTTVMLMNGTYKPIEEVQIGDVLLGENGSSNEVLGFLHHSKPKSPIYGFNGEKPFATEDHAFMTTKGWKSINPEMTKLSSPNLKVGKIEVGDTLVTGKGLVKINSIEIGEIKDGEMVYNFILGGNHTYYANGYLVSDYYNR